MKACVVGEKGVEVREAPKPSPKPNEILIKVRAASLNRADLAVASGHRHGTVGGAGTIVGLECAGEVEAGAPKPRAPGQLEEPRAGSGARRMWLGSGRRSTPRAAGVCPPREPHSARACGLPWIRVSAPGWPRWYRLVRSRRSSLRRPAAIGALVVTSQPPRSATMRHRAAVVPALKCDRLIAACADRA